MPRKHARQPAAKRRGRGHARVARQESATSTHMVRPRQVAHQRPTHAPKLHDGGAKLVTTQVSNLRPARPYAGNQVKNSQMAAVGVLDPFAAFARGYKTGLPFSPMTPPVFGFWTRSVFRNVEVGWTGTANTVGMNALVMPWVKPQILLATTLGAGGQPVPLTVTQVADPQGPFISTNFDTVCVAYQGVRVRNLTNVLQQGGELVIGICSYEQWNANTFDQNRTSSTSITHANGDPGVIAQCAWTGNPANGESSSTTGSLIAVSDYRFVEPSQNTLDPEMRCIFISSVNGGGLAPTPAAQVFEIEVVTYYVGVPLSVPSQILAPIRYDVDPSTVNRMLDAAYNKAPLFSIERHFIKDDGWSDLWTGVKTIVKDIGLGLIGQAAASVGTAFAGLFSGKRRPYAILRLLSLIPHDAYPEVRRLLTEHTELSAAVAAVQSTTVQRSTLTSADLERIAEFLDRDDPVVVPDTPATAAGGPKAAWFGRK